MRFSKVVTMVLVQDIDRALGFYRDVLGFTVQFEEEDWVVFAEQVGLMLSPEPLPLDNININAVMVTLNVDEIEAAYDELLKKGVAFLVPPTDVGGATIASFRDTEGNVLQMVQSS